MNNMSIWCKSIAHSVFKHTRPEITDCNTAVLHMGKNMHTGVQIMLRNSMKSFAITDIKVNGLPGGLKADIKIQDFIFFEAVENARNMILTLLD